MSVEVMKRTLDRISTAESVNVDSSLYRAVVDYVSHTATHGIDKFTYLKEVLEQAEGRLLLDFGCGRAPHRRWIEAAGFDWQGLDLDEPTDFRGESRSIPEVVYYDGTRVPFPDAKFDVIFSSQAFEHVHNPYETMMEVARCLKPGGAFVGSVSFLEPYHAFQTFGYTPFGFMLIAERCGLSPVKLHPNTDGLGLIFRKLLIITKEANANEREESFTLGKLLGPKAENLPPASLNSLRLQFCGHFSFWFVRPGSQAHAERTGNVGDRAS